MAADICVHTRRNHPEAVALRLKSDIESQQLKHGSRLLPLRKLADKYDASYLTMQRAVNLLCVKGFLSSRHGSGVYVNDSEDAQVQTQQVNKKTTISVVFYAAGQYVIEQGLQYTKLMHGIEQEAAEHGMNVVTTTIRSTDEFVKTDTYNNAAGFLILGDDTDSLEPAFRNKAIVQVMGADNKKWGDHVSSNNREIGVIAADYFVSKNHKNLMCINVHEGHGDQRCRAFKEHAEHLGAKVTYLKDSNALIRTDFEQHIEYNFLKECVNQIKNSEPRFSGVFVVDLVAQPLYNFLVEEGIKPGRDIEIATCNWRNTTTAGNRYRPLDIDQCPEEVGIMAMRQLIWRMGNPKIKRMVIKIDPEISESKN